MGCKSSKTESKKTESKKVLKSFIDDIQQGKSKTKEKSTWKNEELLSQLKNIDYETSSNIVRLFDQGDTIPFLCRYRRELIGNFTADE